MKTVTIIVPCYNEADVIPLFYKEISRIISLCKNYSFKLLFVDDGSGDDTLEILRAMAGRSQSIKYISFSRNFGKEAAMLAGMSYADSDYIGIIDADLQHSPDLIPLMLEALEEDDCDVAAARRTDRAGEARLRSFLSASFYKVVNNVSDVQINNNAFDYRIMKKKVVDAILSLPERIRFSKGIFSWVGFKTKWFEHENIERAAGETKWSLRGLMKYALDGILSFTTAPMRIPLWTGIFAMSASVVLFVYGIVRMLVSELFDPLYSLLLSAILFTGALIMIFIGILGEYMARSYVELQNRPVFIVAETNVSPKAAGERADEAVRKAGEVVRMADEAVRRAGELARTADETAKAAGETPKKAGKTARKTNKPAKKADETGGSVDKTETAGDETGGDDNSAAAEDNNG